MTLGLEQRSLSVAPVQKRAQCNPVGARGQCGLQSELLEPGNGSGVGKLVAMAWLEYGCRLAKGIELDAGRHDSAVDALAGLELLP